MKGLCNLRRVIAVTVAGCERGGAIFPEAAAGLGRVARGDGGRPCDRKSTARRDRMCACSCVRLLAVAVQASRRVAALGVFVSVAGAGVGEAAQAAALSWIPTSLRASFGSWSGEELEP